jgi:hypothetical protein
VHHPPHARDGVGVDAGADDLVRRLMPFDVALAGSIGSVIVSMPRFAASARASSRLPRLEYGDGIRTPRTFRGRRPRRRSAPNRWTIGNIKAVWELTERAFSAPQQPLPPHDSPSPHDSADKGAGQAILIACTTL